MTFFRLSLFAVVVLLSFAAFLPTITANIARFDEVWRRRAAEAELAANRTYETDPAKITDAFNKEVHSTLKSLETNGIGTLPMNGTRRILRGKLKRYRGPCIATNPIDRCWRCDPNWHKNRKRLADCALGFGYKTTGGKNGKIYVVTDNSDDSSKPKPGTLRHAVIQKGPLWIIFGRSMEIRLAQELIMQGDKTIDGRGAHVKIRGGAGITIQFIQNVIIHGIRITDIVVGNGGMVADAVNHIGIRTKSDGDGISIFGSSNIWLDHLSMARCTDGIIDVIQGSTGVTISNSHFTDHNEVMLFGAHDSYSRDAIMQVTVAFNHFGKRLIQRMPRCRWGLFHIVNNDYTHWNMYAIGGSSHPTIISQGNRFVAPLNDRLREVTKRDYSPESVWKNWVWRSQGDVFENKAFFVQSGDPKGGDKKLGQFESKVRIAAAPGTSVKDITRFAGALACTVGRPC